jgi:hypothetical protein
MTLQQLVEGVEQVFPKKETGIGRTQILKEFDLAQKTLCSEAGLLESSGSLADVDTYTSWSLPSDFVKLKQVDLYDSDGYPLYIGNLSIDFEVYNGQIHFYSTTTTPLASMPSTISYIILRYEKMPSDIESVTSTVNIDEVEYPAMEAFVFKRLFSRVRMPRYVDKNGEIVSAIDSSSLKYWSEEYYRLKVESKRRNNLLDDTVRSATFYKTAGASYFLKRNKEEEISEITIPSYSSLYSKYVRFSATSPGTLTEIYRFGYGDLTYEMDGNDVKVTSSAEFGVETWGDDTQNSSHAYVDANTFTFTPEPLLDWGTTIIEIWEY